MGIEHSKTRIDYASIAAAYGYQAVPAGFQETPKVDVLIDWETGAEQRRAQQGAAMNDFDSIPLHQSAENARRQEALLNESAIPTNRGNLRLSTEKWFYPEKGNTSLRICLKDEQTGEEIGQYISVKNGNVWDMHDRITSEAYRGKGVASQMIEATENCVQAHANASSQDQFVEVEASQLPVLSVFLGKGYELVDEDKQRFAEVMSALEAGDQKYVLVSCEADFKESREERKTWYVFERQTYEHFGDTIWDYDEAAQKANYMQHSVRFRLRKKIEAKSDDLEGVMAGVHNKLHSLVP